MAGEVPGILRDPAVQPWHEVDLANAAFGQGVAVTPIQLATAYSALVNGGRLVQPQVVLGVGNQPEIRPASNQVLSPGMSKEMTDLMYHVVHTVPWYRDKTLVPGYTVGGKTGTAQIWDPKLRGGRGGWKRTYNHTFIGWIGKKTPRLPDLRTVVDPVLGPNLALHRPVNATSARGDSREFAQEGPAVCPS